MDMTDAIRDYVESKIIKLDNKLKRFGDVVAVDIEVGKTSHHHNKGDVFRCEIHVALPGKMVHVDDTQDDLYKAIVGARDKADRVIVDFKETFDAGRYVDKEDVLPPAKPENKYDGIE